MGGPFHFPRPFRHHVLLTPYPLVQEGALPVIAGTPLTEIVGA